MFVLAVLSDKIKTIPKDFGKDPTQALINAIEMKYSNKILQDVGLGIAFYDFKSVDDGLVYPGEGAAHRRCTFRFVFFRPFVGEVIEGVVEEVSAHGLRVNLFFFDDVFIPKENLPSKARYVKDPDGDGGCFFASSLEDDADGECNGQMDVITGAEEEDEGWWFRTKRRIRFKVREIEFNLNKSTAKGIQTITTTEDKDRREGGSRLRSNSLTLTERESSGVVPPGGLAPKVEVGEPGATFGGRLRSASITKDTTVLEPMPGGDSAAFQRPAGLRIVGTVKEGGLGDPEWWGDD